jgi:hypothetical protein
VAYPIAFPFVKLKYCQKKTHAPYITCLGKGIEEASFIDGGVFNNTPLDLTYDIASDLQVLDNGYFLWINPNQQFIKNRRFDENKIKTSLLSYLASFSDQFVKTSRTRNLTLLTEYHPDLIERLHSTSVTLPRASEGLGRFLGFFEKDFRKFDFYLGMHDAHIFLKDFIDPKFLLPEQFDHPQWSLFYCIKTAYQMSPDQKKYCSIKQKGVDRNDLVLLQTSFNVLYNHCSQLKKDPGNEHLHCQRAFRGKRPPIILKAINKQHRAKTYTKKVNQYYFTQLNKYGFQFKDLSIKGKDTNNGLYAIREKIGESTKVYVSKLPSSERLIVSQGLRTLLNSEIAYIPQSHLYYINVGSSLEFGRNIDFLSTYSQERIRMNLGLLIQ